jgi:hypothetical protein
LSQDRRNREEDASGQRLQCQTNRTVGKQEGAANGEWPIAHGQAIRHSPFAIGALEVRSVGASAVGRCPSGLLCLQ